MIRVLVMTTDPLLAAAIAARLADEISPEAIHVTHHEIDEEDHQPLVIVIEDGKPEGEPIFNPFYSSHFKTH